MPQELEMFQQWNPIGDLMVRFARSFGVPASVDQERIEVDYRDGVLLVHLPKGAEQKSERVQIKVS